jgi:hypothetical protein
MMAKSYETPEWAKNFIRTPQIDANGEYDDIVRFSQRIQNQLNNLPAEEQIVRADEAVSIIAETYKGDILKKQLFLYTLLAYRLYIPEDDSQIGTADEYRNVWVQGQVLRPISITINKPTIAIPLDNAKVSYLSNGEYIDDDIKAPIHVPVEFVSSHLS